MNELNNIQESGFKAPKDYFKSLEDNILNVINDENAASSGMQTPEYYFENLEDRITEAVSKEYSSSKVISLFSKQKLLYFSGIAAALLMMLGVYFNNNDITFDTIEVELVEDYILNQNMDSFELVSILTDADLSTVDLIDGDSYGDILEDYLIEHTNIEDLIIE